MPNGTTPRAPNAYELLAVFDPTDMNADEQAAVWTLIQYLKRKEVADRSDEQRRHNPARTAAAAAGGASNEFDAAGNPHTPSRR